MPLPHRKPQTFPDVETGHVLSEQKNDNESSSTSEAYVQAQQPGINPINPVGDTP